MNKSQKITLWVGALLIVISLAFPPYDMIDYTKYALFTHPPSLPYAHNVTSNVIGFNEVESFGANINQTILRWQCFVIIFLTTIALVTLSGRQSQSAVTPETIIIKEAA